MPLKYSQPVDKTELFSPLPGSIHPPHFPQLQETECSRSFVASIDDDELDDVEEEKDDDPFADDHGLEKSTTRTDDFDEFEDFDEEDFDDEFDDDFEEELNDDYEIEIDDEISNLEDE